MCYPKERWFFASEHGSCSWTCLGHFQCFGSPRPSWLFDLTSHFVPLSPFKAFSLSLLRHFRTDGSCHSISVPPNDIPILWRPSGRPPGAKPRFLFRSKAPGAKAAERIFAEETNARLWCRGGVWFSPTIRPRIWGPFQRAGPHSWTTPGWTNPEIAAPTAAPFQPSARPSDRKHL